MTLPPDLHVKTLIGLAVAFVAFVTVSLRLTGVLDELRHHGPASHVTPVSASDGPPDTAFADEAPLPSGSR